MLLTAGIRTHAGSDRCRPDRRAPRQMLRFAILMILSGARIALDKTRIHADPDTIIDGPGLAITGI